jgi:hypothetical protein
VIKPKGHKYPKESSPDALDELYEVCVHGSHVPVPGEHLVGYRMAHVHDGSVHSLERFVKKDHILFLENGTRNEG